MCCKFLVLFVLFVFPCMPVVWGQTTPSAQEGQGVAVVAPGADVAREPVAAESAARAIRPEQEHWTALPLGESGVHPKAFNAVLLSKIEQPEFTRELVRVEWRLGDPIELSIVLPHGVKNPPVILYLYDSTSDTDRFQNDGWCRQATRGGFAAVGFVSALAGQRFHAPRPMKEWFVSEMQEALGTSTHDVQMVLNYLEQHGGLDVTAVGMFGQGSGGAIAILAASVEPRIAALDLLNPWGDWPEWIKGSRQIPDAERASYLTPEFLAKVAGLDPVSYLPRLKVKALRLQQVMDDLVTPPAAMEAMAAAAPKKEEVVRYKDTVASVKAFREQGLSGWFQEQLGAQAKPELRRGTMVAAVPR